MKILIDTDVLIDVALNRAGFAEESAKVLDWAELNPKQAAIAWHSASNLAYIVKQDARAFLSDLLSFVEVATADTATMRQALALPMSDFEDALQVSSAISFGADIIVTRNVGDYKRLPIRAVSPTRFVQEFMMDDLTDEDTDAD